MRIHFFAAPFLLLSFGSGFRVQGSGFRVQGSGGGFAAFLEEGILDTQPSPMGKAAIRGCRYPRHTAFPAWGRCPEGADRALAV